MSKTINYLVANLVALSGLLTGAAVVHNYYKPDLVRTSAATLVLHQHLPVSMRYTDVKHVVVCRLFHCQIATRSLPSQGSDGVQRRA